jgi:putative MATE family efflux protein
MNREQVLDKRITFFALVWPILIETFLRMFFGTVDTFMLSGYSDSSVAGVGAANQYISILILLFQMVSGGAGIVISQHLGAKDDKKASHVALIAVLFNLLFGILISVIMFALSGKMLELMSFQPEILKYSKQYLIIVGSFSFMQAASITASATLRSYGLVKYPMLVNMGANLLNIIGNAIFIYGLFGAPVLGVKGVAISTISSQAVGLIVMIVVIKRNLGIRFSLSEVLKIPKKEVVEVLKSIFKIGGPSAGESLSYNTSQIVITSFISTMGAFALSTRFYVYNMMFYIMMFGLATAQATQIIIGHLIGAGKKEEAYKSCMYSLKLSVIVSASVAILFAVFGKTLLGLFTDDINIIELGGILFIITIILEPGRSFNLVIGYALKAAGDAKYTLYLGLISMWLVLVTMSYFLGVSMGLGLVGVWIAFAMDEWLRGIMMLKRWKSRAWEKKAVVTKKEGCIEDEDEKLLQTVN